MKDLKKVQEFFSKPLEEVTNDYSPLSYATLVAKGKMDIKDAMKETGFSYDLLKQLVDKVKGVAQNIREQEDPTDIIAMDVPLFLRMLEWAKEEAAEDVDLHKVTERAIEAVKLRGLLSMEDYNDLIGEPIEEETGYSKYLATPENPKGKTPGLTPDIMSKILMKIANVDDIDETTRLGEGVIYEELCPKGKAYIKKRQAAGEKSSAYLSGRAVKVCKGQMKG
jgi:hypothetical protein